MADRAQGAVSFTPIVTIAADSDADAVDAIHHDIKGALGGSLTYTASGNDKWYYAPNVIVTTTSTELIADEADDLTNLVGATGDPAAPNEAIGSEAHFTEGGNIDAGTDDIKLLFIKNTGTSDSTGTTTTNSVYFCLDDGTAAFNGVDSIELAPGEAFLAKMNVKCNDIKIITGTPDAASTAATVNGSQNVRVTVAALIADGGH